MRRITSIAVVATLIALSATGCRSTCGDRHGWFAGRNGSAACLTSGSNDCREVTPASFTPVGLGGQPPAGWMPEGGMPIYPAGDPIPVRPGSVGPENELPFPRIPSPGVPEWAPATPMPAIPQVSGRTPATTRTAGESKSAR